jgi:chlorophyll synthase
MNAMNTVSTPVWPDAIRPPIPAQPPGRSPAMLELLKPITWFAPMWAFGCGVVSSGVPVADRWWAVILGVILAGPMVCGTSQAVNDWFDRHVDAINEPNRPIPSGRLPGRQGLHIATPGPYCRCWWPHRSAAGASAPPS